MVSRFPEVPTIRLIGFPYLLEGMLNAGCIFLFFGRTPLGREKADLARFARSPHYSR